jgi:hypothetical protein
MRTMTGPVWEVWQIILLLQQIIRKLSGSDHGRARNVCFKGGSETTYSNLRRLRDARAARSLGVVFWKRHDPMPYPLSYLPQAPAL